MACPSINALAELVVGGMAGAAGELEAHLASCAPCRRATAALLASTLGAHRRRSVGPSVVRSVGTDDDIGDGAGDDADRRDASTTFAPTHLLAPGTKIGRYVVQELLGAGGMGVVYAARDPELDRRVALKLLHPRRAAAPAAARAELLAEAQAMAKIRHPNVVGVHDVAMHGELVTIAMELVAGGSLRRWLDEPRGWREIVPVMTAAGRGLAAAHALHLVHRDFKPENVLVGAAGQVCVSDFGLALPSGGRSDHPIEGVAGTPAYMAPEQRRGARPDPRADQYSFCLVLREALEGRRPGAGAVITPTTRELLGQLGAAPDASDATSDASDASDATSAGRRYGTTAAPRRNAPRWLRAAIARGLREQPADRFPSMTALLEALRPPRRWPWAVAPVMLAASVALSLLLFSSRMHRHATAGSCAEAPAALRSQWSAQRRAQLVAALERDGRLPTATVTALAADLDRRVRELGAARDAACRANQRDPRAATLFDRQTACLDDRQAALAARLARLEADDAAPRARAVELVSSLPALEDCAATSALLGLPPLPGDAATRRALAAARQALAEATALRTAGQLTEALRALEPARALAYDPLAATVELERGQIHDELGHPVEAEAAFAAAVERGLRGGAGDVVTRALVERAAIRQLRYGDRERSDEYLAQARALHQRDHAAAPLPAELEQLIARLYLGRGQLDLADAALARGQAALAARAAAAASPASPSTAPSSAPAAAPSSAPAAAAVPAPLAHAIDPSFAHPGDRLLARVDQPLLRETAALVLQARGKLPEAQAALREVYAALREALGPQHPSVGRVAAELAVVCEKLGQRDVALEYFAAAERGFGGSPGVDHQAIASISYLMRPQAQHTRALDREHGLRLTAIGAAPRKLEEAVMYSGLGALLLMSAGERTLARHSAERAIALVGKQQVTDLDISLIVMALLELEADERAAARRHAEQVIELQRKRPDPDPITLAHALMIRGIQRHLAGELNAALADFDETAAIAAADATEDTAELDKLLPFWRGATRRRAGLPGTDGAALLRLQVELANDPDVSPQMKPALALAAVALAR